MTNALLSEMDAAIIADLRTAGAADDATFLPAADSVGVPCTVTVDRSVIYQDQTSGIVSHATTITAFRADIGRRDPDVGSLFVIGAEQFVIDKIAENSDESRVVCIVTPRSC